MRPRDSTSPQPSEFRTALSRTVVIHSLPCSYFSQLVLLPRKIFFAINWLREAPAGASRTRQPHTGRKPWTASRHPKLTRNHSIPSDQSALRTLPRQPIQPNTRCPGQLRPQALRLHPASSRGLGWVIGPLSLKGFCLPIGCERGGPSPIGFCWPRWVGKLGEFWSLSVAESWVSGTGRSAYSLTTPRSSQVAVGAGAEPRRKRGGLEGGRQGRRGRPRGVRFPLSGSGERGGGGRWGGRGVADAASRRVQTSPSIRGRIPGLAPRLSAPLTSLRTWMSTRRQFLHPLSGERVVITLRRPW